jgi:acyl-CoA reductase-like NAD-dependent aldehyde dehydrogenase
VPEIAQMETKDCGQTISQTGKQLVPRAADNFTYLAEMCTRVDGHTYPTETHLNYTLFHPVGVCALISPWNVPFMTATWKVAPWLAFGGRVARRRVALARCPAGLVLLAAPVAAAARAVVVARARAPPPVAGCADSEVRWRAAARPLAAPAAVAAQKLPPSVLPPLAGRAVVR